MGSESYRHGSGAEAGHGRQLWNKDKYGLVFFLD